MAQNNQGEIPLKLLIIGNTTVGKTCLLLRYCNNKISTTHITTLGVDFQIKKLEINGKKVKLSIWDTAGQEKFRNITTNFYKGADGMIVTYSIDDRESFDGVENWMNTIKEHCDNAKISIVLVGNKSDVENRIVSKEEGQKLAEKFSVPFLETSALQNIQVSEAFQLLTKLCLEQSEQNKTKKSNSKGSSSTDIDDDIQGPNSRKRLTAKQNTQPKKSCC